MAQQALNEFGIFSRQKRIKKDLVMGDQAEHFKCSVAYISAIERGLRPVPKGYALKFAQWLNLNDEETRQLCELARSVKKVVKVTPRDPERALLADDFAQRLNDLSAETLVGIRELLAAEKTDGERS